MLSEIKTIEVYYLSKKDHHRGLIMTKLLLLILLTASASLVLATAYENYACQDRCNLLYVNNIRRAESCIKMGCS